MEKAFSYMFKDNMFKNKAILYCVLAFGVFYLSRISDLYAKNEHTIMYAIIAYIIYCILYLPMIGYFVSCTKVIMDKEDNIVLPFLNFGKSLWLGLKYLFSSVVFSLLFGLLAVGLIIIPVILVSLGNPALTILGAILFLVSLLLLVVLFIAFLIYIPALICIFAKTEWITSFCRFARATKLIKNDPGQYFISILLYIGIVLVMGVIVAIPIIIVTFTGNIGILFAGSLLYALIATYVVYTTSYIIAKSVDSKLIEE